MRTSGWRFVLLVLVGLVVVACTPLFSSLNKPNDGKSPVEVTLVAFIVTRTAHERLIPKFIEHWQQEHHQAVKFNRSYGASGSQARAVIDGLDADIVHLALGLDVQRLEKVGLITPGWEPKFPHNSVPCKSVVALAVHEGNPKGIQDWQDLSQPSVQVITSDPKTSGVARWNFLALWNAAMQSGASQAQAAQFVETVYKNAPVLPRDAREATDAFAKQERGDVLINYENEMILAAQKGHPLRYIVPRVNISLDTQIAVVDQNTEKHHNQDVAAAYIRYLYTPEAQTVFANLGFRPVDVAVAQQFADRYPAIEHLASVQDYGGWQAVQQQFFAEGALFDRIRANIRK
jgi:sulfate transport system substrate-binding protein